MRIWLSTNSRVKAAACLVVSVAALLFVGMAPQALLPGAALAVSPWAAGPVPPVEIRVGLATDRARLQVDCCDSVSWLVTEAGMRHRVERPVAVRPAPGRASAGVHRLQVAALRDPLRAEALTSRLIELLDQPAGFVLDAATGLYRVRVGAYADREQAEQARGRLRVEGYDDVWIVVEGSVLDEPGFVADGIGRIAGRRLRFESADAVVRIQDRRYRGAIEIFLNDRALINVINAVALEDYLRGVVPLELGPDLYPEIEATKAQAVAARTYAVRHRGEFDAEGYDICASVACQVYGGLEAEHPRSDLAVQVTRGELLVRGGEPIEALFTASCGGSTELVDHVFPLLAGNGPAGVPCVEGGPALLAGGASGKPPALGSRRPTGGLEVAAGNLIRIDGRQLHLRVAGRRRILRLAPTAALMVAEAAPGSEAAAIGRRVGTIEPMPGDRLRAHVRDGEVVAVVHEKPVAAVGEQAETWSVWRSRRSLRQATEKRFPGLALDTLRVLERGVSGRVTRIALVGEERTVEIRGLAIRWLLDLPEHLVTMTAESGSGGRSGWRFEGRGRGHGVGMCQIGAYRMAERGLGYREILWHYYGAVEIGTLGP